jgi:hypothetical protein
MDSKRSRNTQAGKRVVKDLAASDSRDVKGGADTLRLLANVSHQQAESASDDLAKRTTTR